MAEKNEFIKKLEGREIISPHSIGKKVNEIIDQINLAIADEKTQEGEHEEQVIYGIKEKEK